MCVTSVIIKYMSDIPYTAWDPSTYERFMTMLHSAKELDTLLQQPHCEDPQKEKFVDELTKRFAQ